MRMDKKISSSIEPILQPAVKVHLFAPDISKAFKQHWNFEGQTTLKGMPGSEQVSV